MDVREPEERVKKKAVTLQDVARRAGTAKSTASMALNGKSWVSPETRELVLKAAREMNFEFDPSAKRLSMGRDYGTVVLLSQHLDLGVGSEKVQTIQRQLNARGFNAPIHGYASSTDRRQDVQTKLILDLCRQRPQAIVYNTSECLVAPEARESLQNYRDEGGTLLSYDWPAELDCDSVVFDREDNTYQAARHLLQIGHRKLGLFEAGTGSKASLRRSGFRRALCEFQLDIEPRWIFAYNSYSDCEASGIFLADAFLNMPVAERPSALCIVNDLTALVFVSRLQQHGVQVPRDVSVVGHDDLMIARYGAVPLTTVSQPVETIADCVVELLCLRLKTPSGIAQDHPPRHKVVRGQLVQRQSTAPP